MHKSKPTTLNLVFAIGCIFIAVAFGMFALAVEYQAKPSAHGNESEFWTYTSIALVALAFGGNEVYQICKGGK